MQTPIRKTRRAYDLPGHTHFLTFSCFKRIPLLVSDRSRAWIVEALESARQSHNFELWAYVIMPEHVHVLIKPYDHKYEMRKILNAIKRPVSDAARNYLTETDNTEFLNRLTVNYPSRKVFRFWQPGGGFDRNLFKETTVLKAIEYIHANPIRRGLVKLPTDWTWSSAQFWAGEQDVPIRMDRPFARSTVNEAQ